MQNIQKPKYLVAENPVVKLNRKLQGFVVKCYFAMNYVSKGLV